MNRLLMLTTTVLFGLAAAPSDAQTFSYDPPGKLTAGSGSGYTSSTVFAPGMRFPVEKAPAFANSQVWGVGGSQGPSGSQCATANFSYPWQDNYCEKRTWTMPLCPTGQGHQGQDIRAATCTKNVHNVVASEAGTITNIGTYSVYVQSGGTLFRYLHMNIAGLGLYVGKSIAKGQIIGRVSNEFGGTPTSVHLHYDIKQNVSGLGNIFVSPYMSLVQSYQQLIGNTCPGNPSVVCPAGGCACNPGQLQSQACGNCGTRTRACSNSCSWGSWSSCGGQGTCAPGTTQNQGCGNCGTRARTCKNSCTWGSWGSCTGQGACAPGATDTDSCGNCGSRTRTCGAGCGWSGWSSCAGEGPCAPGEVDTETCCDCGERSRTCSNSCGWQAWSACEGPDPIGAPECDTGKLGDCATGTTRCIAGCLTCTDATEPAPEQCDDRDNDCDGETDETALEVGSPPAQYAATLVDLSAPTGLAVGSTETVWAEFRNDGQRTWEPDRVALRALGPNESLSPLWTDGAWSAWDVAVRLNAPVPPGEHVRLAFPVTLPPDDADQSAATRFHLMVAGDTIRCPSPSFEMSVVSLPDTTEPAESDAPKRTIVARPTAVSPPEPPAGGGAVPDPTGTPPVQQGTATETGCQHSPGAPSSPMMPLALLLMVLALSLRARRNA